VDSVVVAKQAAQQCEAVMMAQSGAHLMQPAELGALRHQQSAAPYYTLPVFAVRLRKNYRSHEVRWACTLRRPIPSHAAGRCCACAHLLTNGWISVE
jgi:hypothetical protein